MKKLNSTDYEVLELILRGNEISRTEIAENLNISAAGITKIIKRLMTENLIFEIGLKESTGGRPRKVLKINKEYKKIIGLNFGAGFLEISVGYIDGTLIETRRRNFYFKTSDKLQVLLTDEISYFISKYDKNNIIGIGIALNGIVDSYNGISIFSPHLKWKNWKIKEYIESKFNIPVLVDNDVRCMLKAEMYKYKANKFDTAMFFYFRDGIGSSIVINNNIHEGLNHSAGEIGHFIINNNSNSKCKCGKYGCLESEYSVKAIKDKISWELEKVGKEFLEDEDNKNIFVKASLLEEPYHSVVKKASFEIGKVVGNVLNVLDIGNVIVAGDILHSKQIFFNNFEKGINQMISPNFGMGVNMYVSEFGENIEQYSALFLIIMNLFKGEKLIC